MGTRGRGGAQVVRQLAQVLGPGEGALLPPHCRVSQGGQHAAHVRCQGAATPCHFQSRLDEARRNRITGT